MMRRFGMVCSMAWVMCFAVFGWLACMMKYNGMRLLDAVICLLVCSLVFGMVSVLGTVIKRREEARIRRSLRKRGSFDFKLDQVAWKTPRTINTCRLVDPEEIF